MTGLDLSATSPTLTNAGNVSRQIRRLAVLDGGESAVRVLLAVAELNRQAELSPITTVVLHAEPQHEAWYSREADEALALGPELYLHGADGRVHARRLDNAATVALLAQHHIDAVWLGRTVVDDLLDFTVRCEEADITVVGPSAATVRILADRLALRRAADEVGVPVLPYVPSVVAGPRVARAAATDLGYPVVVWDPRYARRGAHRVTSDEELADALAGIAAARRRREVGRAAEDADGGVFIERDPGPGRRLEVEVLADDAGTVWPLAVRDASVQRSGHRVLIESSTSGVPAALLDRIRDAAATISRAVGLRNAGAVQFFLTPDGSYYLTGIDARVQADHALTEEVTGRGPLSLRLALAAGARLDGPMPHADGYAVEAYLFARDSEQEFVDSPGHVALLALPNGTGVRVDAGVREGDLVSDEVSPLLATITARGRDRPEALSRLRTALERLTVVIDAGATDRTFLLAVLARPELAAGPVDDRWLDGLLADGELTAPLDPVALAAAAVEAYDGDQALAESAFHAAAARGRPERPEAVGARMELNYRGVHYPLRVDRTGPGLYHVHAGPGVAGGGAVTVQVGVERINRFERRISVCDKRHRVVAVPDTSGYRLEFDGRTHVITREDGFVVRAGWPAFVVSLLVGVGDRVTVGQQVAVLESMKMESAVASPVTGEVVALDVTPNAQVDAGAPLLRVRTTGTTPFMRTPAPGTAPRVDLAPLAACSDETGPECTRLYAALSSYLLGYDLAPATLKDLLTRQQAVGNGSGGASGDPLAHGGAVVADPALVDCENAFLDLYADLAALYRPTTAVVDGEGELSARGTQEYLNAYLQWLDADRAGLPAAYRERLERALARYGVIGLRRTPQLESAVVRLFRSVGRVKELTPAAVAILQRRLHHRAALADLPALVAPDARARLDRLAAATQPRQQVVAHLARDVRFHYLDEPVVEGAIDATRRAMEGHLAALGADPYRPDRGEHLQQLINCPQPLRGTLLHAWRASEDPSLHDTVLEVYTRRFYRIRALHDLVLGTAKGPDRSLRYAAADYESEGGPVHVVVAFTPLAGLEAVAHALAGHLVDVPARREIVVDVVCWREGPRPDIAQTAEELRALLEQVRFGRRLHRLDITITHHGGDLEEHFRTQHVTFRQADDGAFTEETLYRNLHPMLAKRLSIWRLTNFRLERLGSPEDIYLFLGVARDNLKDRRLFALAEVRDLTSVTDPRTGRVSYPQLERMGLQALSAMRGALASCPERDRPVANRVVLYVRPPWDVPRESWGSLARAFAPLAAGAGLEKVVVWVRLPSGDGLRDAVLHVEGLGGHGVTVREQPPSNAPLLPLDDYHQNVLLAKRFGAPYPYEIVRMLTPQAGTSGQFPPGTFAEFDLDADGTLIPVTRDPGGNSAHVVVGLITNYTTKVPEGMTRVAIFGDPTKGLGNLAGPECARINAALDLAERLRIPVEWFAVSSGALIAMDSGCESMDQIAATLRRIIEFTQAGGEINVIVTGINVGGQPYWNAEATMLMHTRGILVMNPASAMVLTGKQALDFSGGVSAEDNFGIGGYDRVMGPNGQAQYWAPSFEEACQILLAHYEHTYVVPGERFPRRRTTDDPADRDVRESPHAAIPGSDFTRVGDVFEANPDRKKPFDMRSVMRAVCDTDAEPLERWARWKGGETSIVWDTHVGGIAVCMLGLESRNVARRGFVPADGPPQWTSGTLFPQSSRKTARAINVASGNRPLVVLANLSGFDGSPESMRRWQLEYGAEIGRAVTNFRGPIVFVVVSRYHGGAFVVFSKALNPSLEIAAVEGSYASVIGGAPAAATVFAREVKARTEQDVRVAALRQELAAATGPAAAALRARLQEVTDTVRSAKLGEVAEEFDGIHTVERALRVGSVDRIIAARDLRRYVIDALERGMAR
jgi:acetyl/propionyl-CoA carboxylase alpha subunit/acetyl-CoA carboxylase carboxyltransferase component